MIYEDKEEITASEKKCLLPLTKPWLKCGLLAKKGKRDDVIKGEMFCMELVNFWNQNHNYRQKTPVVCFSC